MKKRHIITILFVGILVCGPVFAAGQKEGTLPAAPAARKITMTASTINPEGSLLANALVDLCDTINKKSGGSIEFKTFLGGRVGNIQTLHQSVISGDIDFILIDPGTFAGSHPVFSILDSAFVFRDRDHFMEVLSTPGRFAFFEDLLLKDPGLRVLMYVGGGERGLVTLFPVNKLSDLKGKNMRSRPIPVEMDWFKALGTNPIAIDFNELYTALQTKVVEGTQNSFDAAIKQRFGEVAKYFARTQHAFNLLLGVMNEKKFASLAPEQQKVIREASAEMQKKHIQIAFDAEEALAKKLQADFGVTITYPDKAEMIEVSRSLLYGRAKKLNVEAEIRKIFN